MNIVKMLLGLVIVILLSACATSGNVKLQEQTQSSISQQITEGKTTKSDVVNIFGQATKVSLTNEGTEVWTYEHSRATPHAKNFVPFVRLISSSADVKTKQLVILFNKDNVVSKYTMTESENVVNTGLAH